MNSYKQKKLKEFDKKFPSFLTDRCPMDGTVRPTEDLWWVFAQGHNKTLPQDIKQFISTLMDETEKQAYKRVRENKIPVNAFQWKDHGIKHGYWDYFVEQIQIESNSLMREDLIRWAENYDGRNHQDIRH